MNNSVNNCEHKFTVVVEEKNDYSISSGQILSRKVTKLACEKCGEVKELL